MDQKNNHTKISISLRNRITDIFLYLSIGVFLFGAGYKYAEWSIKRDARDRFTYTIFNSNTENAPENIDFGLFWDTWQQLEKKYIDEEKLDPQQMFYGAIKGMVASVGDPYTFFLTPEENEQSKDDLGGRFEGIGAQLGLRDSRIVVIAPLKNSPAEQAGVRAGDVILAVDGEDTQSWTLHEAVTKIRGPANSEVVLSVGRGSNDRDITITRGEIKVPSVELTYQNENDFDIAYLKLNQFGETTNTEWNNAVNEIQQKYTIGTIDGMILDVRDNPGGYLEGAVHIASDFLQRGDMIVTQETTVGTSKVYKSTRNGKLQDIPLVTLINHGSASASEILAGALRDHDRTVLVGSQSFGKGSVQEALDLKEGAGLRVTVAKWILPDGDWINDTGLAPQIEVENEVPEGETLSDESDEQLKRAIQELQSNIK